MIFVDSSYWIALRNRRDSHHEAGVKLLEEAADQTLVTTNHVRGETWTYLRRRAGHRAAVAFLDVLEASPRVRVVSVDPSQEKRALTWLRRRSEREYSFVDATSFVVMNALNLWAALAFDGDFTAAGFVERRP